MPDVLDPDGVLVLGESDHVGRLAGWQEGMGLELSELMREVRVLLGTDVPVSKEEHLELDERSPEFLQEGRICGSRKIDPSNFGAHAGALECGFEMIEVERVEPLTLTRDVFARSVLRLALDIHGRWIFMTEPQ